MNIEFAKNLQWHNFQKHVFEICIFIKTSKYAKRLNNAYLKKRVNGLGMDRYNIVGCIYIKKQSDAFGENIGNANQKSEEGSNKVDVTT